MKFKTKLYVAALAAASAGLTLPAVAQIGGSGYPAGSPQSAPAGSAPSSSPSSSPGAAPSADFSKLDTNGDGSISKQEARKDKALGKAFDSLDTNKDGKLDAAEFSAYTGGSGGSMSGPASKPSSKP